MMDKIKILVLTLITVLFCDTAFSVPVYVKALQIKQANSAIRLDGILDEEDWVNADLAGDFHRRPGTG